MDIARLRAWATGPALDLAVFRITVGLVILWASEIHRAALRAAHLAAPLRTAPSGLDWIAAHVPITPELAQIAHHAVIGGAILGTLGLRPRAAFTVVTLAGLYLWAIPQLAGHVFHYHHLVWFSALLASSPCGDALSLDRFIAKRRGAPLPLPSDDVAYGAPVRVAWILIGFVYLFPGAWKLATSGVAWFWSDNLRNHMHAKWAQMDGFEPLFRVDRHPTLVRLGALSVIVLELAFLPMVLFRRTRAVAVVAALVFHQLTWYFMGLRFPALWLCYTVFVPWARVLARLGVRGEAPTTAVRRSTAPVLAVAAVLLLGNGAFGIAGDSDGWPFACYPKFDRLAPSTIPSLEVEVVGASGAARTLDTALLFPGGRTQRYWAFTWSLVGAHRRARASPARFRAFWATVAGRAAIRRATDGAAAIRFYRATISTRPEARGAPPLRRTLLYEMPLTPSS